MLLCGGNRATDLSAAGDCLLGLNPNVATHAVASAALARFNGHFFRLRTVKPKDSYRGVPPAAGAGAAAAPAAPAAAAAAVAVAGRPAVCSWAPLCSVLAHGGHATDNLNELTAAPQVRNDAFVSHLRPPFLLLLNSPSSLKQSTTG